MGGSLLGQKKFTEAEPLLLQGYEGMKQREDKIPPVGRPRLREAIERLREVLRNDEPARPGRRVEPKTGGVRKGARIAAPEPIAVSRRAPTILPDF